MLKIYVHRNTHNLFTLIEMVDEGDDDNDGCDAVVVVAATATRTRHKSKNTNYALEHSQSLIF